MDTIKTGITDRWLSILYNQKIKVSSAFHPLLWVRKQIRDMLIHGPLL